MNPDWIPVAAAEAHKLGMHVHGHVPAHMRPWDAVKAGYDEITHINFVAMQAMPDDVVNQANTAQRIEGPAKYFKDVDLSAEPMRSRKRNVSWYARTSTCWPLSTRSPVSGSVKAVARPPSVGLASSTVTRAPASAAAHAAPN